MNNVSAHEKRLSTCPPALQGVGASPISRLSQADSPLLQRLAVGLTLGHMLQYEANADHHTVRGGRVMVG